MLEIVLVRSAPYPGAKVVDPQDFDYDEKQFTDLAQHEFTYALYPHPGRYEQGGVVRAAYELNVPVRIVKAGVHDGELPLAYSFFTIDNPAVVIEAIKLAEASDDIIVRLYETSGGRQRARLHSGIPLQKAELVNLMEEPLQELSVEDNGVFLTFGPYEIHTVKFRSRS